MICTDARLHLHERCIMPLARLLACTTVFLIRNTCCVIMYPWQCSMQGIVRCNGHTFCHDSVLLQGVSETKEDRHRDKMRKQAAEDYDDFDKRIEKHWSEKKREEMTERDWRIFREDFNISYKGNTGGTLPMRNWEEAGLPDELMRVCLTQLLPPILLSSTKLSCRAECLQHSMQKYIDW